MRISAISCGITVNILNGLLLKAKIHAVKILRESLPDKAFQGVMIPTGRGGSDCESEIEGTRDDWNLF